MHEIIGRSDIKNKEYYKELKELQKERFKKISECRNKIGVSESVEFSRMQKDIERKDKDKKELDIMEKGPDYIDLINRSYREKVKYPYKDISVIIKEQQEQIKKENSEAML